MTTHLDESLYRIEQVAARTGLTKRTLRYYEEIGLLAAPSRTDGNYRLYTEADVARLERICQLKEALGLTLAELTDFIAMEEARDEIRTTFAESADPHERLVQLDRADAIAQQQLVLVDKKLATLQATRVALLERLARYERHRADITDHLPAQP
ncbi:MAG: MerR family transcriptional regulator [Ktedonobacterales bacterium]|nr:MerR family transcriptional regulator [Ktedonobacterales bacterium]